MYVGIPDKKKEGMEFYDFLQLNTESINGSEVIDHHNSRKDDEEVNQEAMAADNVKDKVKDKDGVVVVPFIDFFSLIPSKPPNSSN